MNNEFTLLGPRIDDSKQENITFLIDLNEEQDIRSNYLLTNTANKQVNNKLQTLIDEICSFCSLKSYISTKRVLFSLYVITNKLIKICDLTSSNEFIGIVRDNTKSLYSKISTYNKLDMAEIYQEAFDLMPTLQLEMSLRMIMFYNRSDTPVFNSNETDYNLITFIRMPNFYLDIVFLRKKIKTDEDKKKLTDVFNSLTMLKQKFWYAFELSDNVGKLKNIFNLLLANPSQRVRFLDLEKFQKGIEEFITPYLKK